MAFIHSFLTGFFSIIYAVSAFLGINLGQSIQPKDTTNLSFAVISDTHLTDSTVRQQMLRQALDDMSRSGTLDAVVHAGDITEHGEKAQFDMVFEAFDENCKIKNVILATGNHDTWCDEGVDVGARYFIDGYNKLTGRSIEKTYYSTVVNGYTFIVLGSESDGVDAYISDAQISWFETELAKAAQSGKPIFIVCHQPINGANGQAEIWEEGGIGEQSDKVLSAMKKYDNIFYISGHLHAGLSKEFSIENIGGINYINLPSYMYLNTESGNFLSGCGYVFEVYDDSVLIRARSFSMTYWLAQYNMSIELD